MVKKCLAVLISVCVLITSTIIVRAEEIENSKEIGNISTASVELSAKEKTEFAAFAQKKYEISVANGEFMTASISENEELVTKAAASTGEEKLRLSSELEKRGVYELVKSNETTNRTRMGTSDILMRTPTTYYDADNRCWYITYSGRWVNDNWNNTLFWGDVGDADAYGISYTQTSDNYTSYVMSSFAHIYDEDEQVYLNTRVRSDGNGANGFGFRLQDRTEIYNWNKIYVGYCWGVTCTYSESFGSYSGVATGYYIHTYDEAYISSLTIGVEGKTGGLSFTIQNSNLSFIGYSDDFRF